MVLPGGLFEHVGNTVETEGHHHFGTSLEIIEILRRIYNKEKFANSLVWELLCIHINIQYYQIY